MSTVGNAPGATIVPPLVREKVDAFARLEPEFNRCFVYVQAVQGEVRFLAFPIEAAVRYLHALWVCEVKDCLLDVPRTIERYEGAQALRVLDAWQRGDVAEAVEFLQRKLDALPFGAITRQMVARANAPEVVARLEHGRRIMLNRGLTLMLALDAICTLPAEDCVNAARAAAASYGYTPEVIAHELAKADSPLFRQVRHPILARRNMLVMNRLGEWVTSMPVNHPGDRTDRVEAPTMPRGPYAQERIAGEREMTPPPYSTGRYFPATTAEALWMNGPSPIPRVMDPTGDAELHPAIGRSGPDATDAPDATSHVGGLMAGPGDANDPPKHPGEHP